MQDPLAITGTEPVGEIGEPRLPPLSVSTEGGRLAVQFAGRDVTGAVESVTAMMHAGARPRVHLTFRDDVAAEFVAFAAEDALLSSGNIPELVREYLTTLDVTALETEVANRPADMGSSLVGQVLAVIIEGLDGG